jgi:hypothetical protein
VREQGLTLESFAACVSGPSSTLCDALSTAMLVGGATFRRRLRERFPSYESWAA